MIWVRFTGGIKHKTRKTYNTDNTDNTDKTDKDTKDQFLLFGTIIVLEYITTLCYLEHMREIGSTFIKFQDLGNFNGVYLNFLGNS